MPIPYEVQTLRHLAFETFGGYGFGFGLTISCLITGTGAWIFTTSLFFNLLFEEPIYTIFQYKLYI